MARQNFALSVKIEWRKLRILGSYVRYLFLYSYTVLLATKSRFLYSVATNKCLVGWFIDTFWFAKEVTQSCKRRIEIVFTVTSYMKVFCWGSYLSQYSSKDVRFIKLRAYSFLCFMKSFLQKTEL